MDTQEPYLYVGTFKAYNERNREKSGFASVVAMNDEEAEFNFTLIGLSILPEREGWHRHWHQFAKAQERMIYINPETGENKHYRIRMEVD